MRKKVERVVGVCGACRHCRPVYAPFHLLSLDGKPTLGECPYMERRKVLLSEHGCKNFKPI